METKEQKRIKELEFVKKKGLLKLLDVHKVLQANDIFKKLLKQEVTKGWLSEKSYIYQDYVVNDRFVASIYEEAEDNNVSNNMSAEDLAQFGYNRILEG